MKSFLILFVAIVCVSSLAAAQTVRGSIHGVVVDAQNNTVPDASIKLISTETGHERTNQASGKGLFIFSAIPAGSYSVVADKPGFLTSTINITLSVNQDARVTVAMASATAAKESLSVTGYAPLLRTESGALSGVIGNAQVQNLPLDGRNFYDLSLLLPGVSPPAQGSAGSARGDFALNVNGAREDGNLFLLDGVYNGDPKLNGVGVQPPVDGIREFETLLSSYDASFGRNSGGQVNVVLRSGGNQFHGTAYEFLRNDALDARNYFAPEGSAPKYRRNQFGFSLGGPIRRNKTFFFGDYEARRVREGITRITNVPTALERVGDFSQSGGFVINPLTQQPFPGGVIPAAFQHPVGRAIAALYPLPNRNVRGQNFVSSPTFRDRSDQFDVRLDHAITSRTEFSGRYSMGDREFFDPFSGAGFSLVPGFGTTVPRRGQNAMASVTHAFTPNVLNEFRLGYSRTALRTQQENIGTNLNHQVGLPSPWTNSRDNGLTFISLTGFSPLGDEYNNPQSGVTNTYQLIDHVSWTRNRHLFKAGADIRKLEQNAFRDVQTRGLINFLGQTGSSLAEMLLGLVSVSGVATADNPQHLRSESYNFFVHDTWRVTSRLTLNLGLRYEFNTPGVDKFDRANLYDVSTGTLAAVGKNGFPRSGYAADRNNFAPRLGLAYSLNPNTVLRAGYGFFYDQGSLAPTEGLYFSAPYYTFRLFFSLPTSPVLLHDPFPANFPFPTPSSATAFQRDLRTPYLQQWNFNIQRSLGSNRVFDAGYVGSKGSKLYASRDINQPRPTPAERYLRPNPFFDDVNILESRSNSNYHSLQARYQQRLAAGLQTLVSYTWSKSIDDSSSFFTSAGDSNFPQDSLNVRAERGRSNFDVAHRAVVSFSYDLPIAKGHRFLGGWQAQGIISAQTGRPFTVALLPDFDNSNTGRSVLGFGANDRPHALKDATLSSPTVERWFDTTAFAIPPRGVFGNAGRNILSGPGLQTWNLSLLKSTQIAEQATLQLRAEFFNAFDRANFGLPDNFAGSPTFGRIQTAGDPRRLQLGLKLLF